MRLMLGTFAVIFLVLVDQSQCQGYYGMQLARLVVAGLAQLGL